MPEYGLFIDLTRCNGCYNCFLACRDEHCGNDFPPYSQAQPMTGHFWMKLIEKERGQYPKVKVGYIAIPCMHCQDPPCIKYSPEGTVYQRDDGIVIVDPVKSKGQKQIIDTCPYRCIYWNEELSIPQKCTLCAHLLDQGWKEPRCVEACPTGALLFGDISDSNSEISQVMAKAKPEYLHPEYGTQPKVLYTGLPGRFIAGEVILHDRRDECAEGVKVTLSGKGKKQETQTDNYGDFEFEGLDADREYTLVVEHKGYRTKNITTKTITDIYLGEIVLDTDR